MADEDEIPLEMFIKVDNDDDSDDGFGVGGVIVQEDIAPAVLTLEHPGPERTPFELGKYIIILYELIVSFGN